MTALINDTLAFACNDSSWQEQREAYQRMCSDFTYVAGQQRAFTLPGELSAVPVQYHCPDVDPPSHGWPAILYIHGGGWVFGDSQSHAPFCSWLANKLQAVVIGVKYRLAPEYPFPAALEDCLSVWRAIMNKEWISQACEQPVPSLDLQRVAVVGDSAGGTLAASLCLALHEQGESLPRAQVLFYPALSPVPLDSARRHASAPLLSARDMQTYLHAYLPDIAMYSSPLALPLSAAQLKRMPPSYIALAQYDPLRDEGMEYARRLAKSGIPVRIDPGRGLVHGCIRGLGHVPEVNRWCKRSVKWLSTQLR